MLTDTAFTSKTSNSIKHAIISLLVQINKSARPCPSSPPFVPPWTLHTLFNPNINITSFSLHLHLLLPLLSLTTGARRKARRGKGRLQFLYQLDYFLPSCKEHQYMPWGQAWMNLAYLSIGSWEIVLRSNTIKMNGNRILPRLDLHDYTFVK